MQNCPLLVAGGFGGGFQGVLVFFQFLYCDNAGVLCMVPGFIFPGEEALDGYGDPGEAVKGVYQETQQYPDVKFVFRQYHQWTI